MTFSFLNAALTLWRRFIGGDAYQSKYGYRNYSYLLVLVLIKTPFLYVVGVNVVCKAFNGRYFKFFHILKYFCKLNHPIETSSAMRALTGHSLEFGERIFTFPQGSKLKCLIKLINAFHKCPFHFPISTQQVFHESQLKVFSYRSTWKGSRQSRNIKQTCKMFWQCPR